MAGQPSDNEMLDSVPDRIAHYWKKAAEIYHLASTSERGETRAGYLGIAMGWTAMAKELKGVNGISQQELDDVRNSR